MWSLRLIKTNRIVLQQKLCWVWYLCICIPAKPCFRKIHTSQHDYERFFLFLALGELNDWGLQSLFFHLWLLSDINVTAQIKLATLDCWLHFFPTSIFRPCHGPSVCPSRPDKSKCAGISGHFGEIAQITPKFLWFCARLAHYLAVC